MMSPNPMSLPRAFRRVGLAMALVLASSCGDTPTGPAKQIPDRVVLQVAGATQMASLGDSITVTVQVLDTKGAPIAGIPFVYSTSSTGVVESLGGGVFRAVGNGQTRVIVALAQDVPRTGPGGQQLVHVADSINVTVSQVVNALTMQAFDSTFWSRGYTRQISAALSDARGNAVPGTLARVVWTSLDAAVAVVDSTGRVASVSDGATRIRGTFNGFTGEAPVRVSSRIPVSKCVNYVVSGQAVQRCAALEFIATERATP